MKLVVVTNILTPYRIPLFDAMRERTSRFTVLLMAEQEENRDWTLPSASFECEVLDGFHVKLPGAERSLHMNTGVMRRLRQLRPDVVLSGGYAPANCAAWLYCRMHGAKYVGWGELSLAEKVPLLKRVIRRTISRGSAAAIASSSDAKEVFERMGTDPNCVLTAVMPIDVGFFNAGARSFRLRSEFVSQRAAYPGAVLLSIGQLVDRKGYRELFDIYGHVLAKRPDAVLLILGDGPKRAEYQSIVASRGWSGVQFLGFRQADDVVRYLALADVFVFATLSDPFGAVLAEAMAAELPVVASCFAAATRDLIDEGVTGYRINPREPRSAAEKILKVLAMSSIERRDLGDRAYQQVRRHDARATADKMVSFLNAVQAGGV